ncbi:MAG: cellulase family glycosylhydrolase [Verrucomicrobiota bacterium]|nr:cellulase family glycosylhydrolase [Limisphaera sp.]MDW8382084.1 cellulase family glycosylhydrolase [Verrucomicrobiota bacterium]
MTRRQFLQMAFFAAASLRLEESTLLASRPRELPEPRASRLPRWRGFNLLEKFIARPEGNPPFRESDFEWIAEWGFDFVRLPMSYRCWTTIEKPRELKEDQLVHVDQAVEWGRQYKVHVNLNLHRAPGYCVNPPREPWDLWTDTLALELCAHQWAHFAKRYRGIPNRYLSFDLLNEPPDISEATYTRVIRHLVAAIRAEDPDRLIVVDGLRWGRDPVLDLKELGVAQSTRGYDPMEISHYRAAWIPGSDQWPVPTWPLRRKGQVVDKEVLRKERMEPWRQLEASGVGVHVGEWGAHNQTPHTVVLAWMRDCLDLWKQAGWGWALWNLRGSFGVVDSHRADVKYESFRGHQLDRAMLDLLQNG